jgi:heme O synthase-like polyprenyltransferase
MSKLAQYSKAIGAALGAFAGALGFALTDGSVSVNEWITVAVTAITAAVAAFAAPKNAVADGEV